MFEILEHTADIGLRAWGRSRKEMYENAALALESVAFELENVEPRLAYPIAASGADEESLLVNWLSEVLYYLDGRRILMRRFRISDATDCEIRGQGWGEPHDPARHAAKVIVKGVTYHQLKVTHEEGEWRAEVYLDI